MAIEKMRLINIISDRKYLDDVLARFVTLKSFHPEPATKFVDSVHGLEMLNEANPYEEPLNQIKELANLMGMELTYQNKADDSYDLEAIKQKIEEMKEQFSHAMSVRKDLKMVIQENTDAKMQMENLRGLGISVDDLFSTRYLRVRFGRLPLDSVDKLKYYQNKPFVFKSLNCDSVYSWCMYMTTAHYEGEVDNVFSSLYFERIRIPEFVHDEPEKAVENLAKEIEDDESQIAHVEEVMKQIILDNEETIQAIYSILCKKNIMFEAHKYVVCLGERFSITGFVAKDDVDNVMNVYDDMKNVVEIENRPPHSDKRLTPPTKLKNGWLPRPFSLFVEMYGVPAYNEFDPTLLVAISYLLLFGIMFGDLGQGLLLTVVSAILYRKKGWALAAIGERIGISSAFFGFLYGSVFGNETMLNPLYKTLFHLKEKPIEVLDSSFTMTLLIAAVAIGIVLILICMLINTILNFKNNHLGEALFSHNGVSGLVFYTSVLVAIVAMMSGANFVNIGYVALLIVLPLVFMFLKEPLTHKLEKKAMFKEGFGSFAMESFFELFEVMLTYISNTMSFLRVGGFVLSHAGMMLVVMTLAEMVGPAFAWLVIIIGNIFVMCMEGMIVGIQVLRLEFDEMFSRYFEGKGIPFESIAIDIK
ncbi:MAG: V-type ATP synthase subunit I [Erysipelotrichia bacterium]|nr:V-type ATP synthase subunit I [Erysipelotrichia bacterium]